MISKFNGNELEAIKNEFRAEVDNFTRILEAINIEGQSITQKEIWKSPTQEVISEKWETFSKDFSYVCDNLKANVDFLQNAITTYDTYLTNEAKAISDSKEALKGTDFKISSN